ncbi:MAG: hypothetical protein GX477_04065 [Clostridiaceae bacterium]|jgi:hypothetical protein|nr:hypothetical protein [Clostridiaceae bacterium]
MSVNGMMVQNISSIRHTLAIATLRKNLGHDVQTMSALLRGFRAVNAKMMENSVTPHKGGNIDIRI